MKRGVLGITCLTAIVCLSSRATSQCTDFSGKFEGSCESRDPVNGVVLSIGTMKLNNEQDGCGHIQFDGHEYRFNKVYRDEFTFPGPIESRLETVLTWKNNHTEIETVTHANNRRANGDLFVDGSHNLYHFVGAQLILEGTTLYETGELYLRCTLNRK